MTDTVAIGRRFSHTYLGGGDPQSDSPRMRRRLSVACPDAYFLHRHLEAELGVYVQYRTHLRTGVGGVTLEFFTKSALRDVLDAVTLIYKYDLPAQRDRAQKWLSDVRRVFAEENLAYSVDEEGGVHYSVDSAFEAVKASTLHSLRGSRYANASAMFEQGMRSLDATPPNGKDAIRAVFSSAEGLFRVMYPDVPRLGAQEADRMIGPELARVYGEDQTARHAASKLLGSFKSWVDGAHFYRHEPGQEEVAQPPLDLAVLMIQQGAGFIRWLAQLDQWRG